MLACRFLQRKQKGFLGRLRPYLHIVALAALLLCAFGALFFEARVDFTQVGCLA